MNNADKLITSIFNNINQGIIYVDSNYKLRIMNNKAKDILGINTLNSPFHPAGSISSGDIVIIADNMLGFDDGGLTAEDLSIINIHNSSIKSDSVFLGIGVYKDNTVAPIYKYMAGTGITGSLTLHTNFRGFEIEASVLEDLKRLLIVIDGEEYGLDYMRSSGHMVIIDGTTRKVKFYQAKGYSVRKEYLKDILYGSNFQSKGTDEDYSALIGKDFSNIVEDGELNLSIKDVLAGTAPPIYDKLFDLNKIIVRCSLIPICLDNNVDGILINIIDLSEWKELLEDRNNVIAELEEAYKRLQVKQEKDSDDTFSEFIGNSPEMQRVKNLAKKASLSDSNVLITGESGTGKSQLAYEIHSHYKPSSPFVEVNCSAIPKSLFESELFGYVGGAFTGALSSGKVGYFEMANGGTIFLDEIGEIPLDMQAKLLQVLQQKRFYRIGSSKPVMINVKVISATNRDLAQEVINKTFRQDLYYRLNVFPIKIPPLRSHKSEIYVLADKIIANICSRQGMSAKFFSGEALNKLVSYDWPGNVRELENIIERACSISDGDIIYPEFIDLPVEHSFVTLKSAVHDAEKQAILTALDYTNGDKNAAIKMLDISKTGFYEKIKKYGINIF